MNTLILNTVKKWLKLRATRQDISVMTMMKIKYHTRLLPQPLKLIILNLPLKLNILNLPLKLNILNLPLKLNILNLNIQLIIFLLELMLVKNMSPLFKSTLHPLGPELQVIDLCSLNLLLSTTTIISQL